MFKKKALLKLGSMSKFTKFVTKKKKKKLACIIVTEVKNCPTCVQYAN